MLKRMSFTLAVMTSLTALYWLYALVVTPRLVPKLLMAQQRPGEEYDKPKAEPPPGNIEYAERFLPDAPWAVDANFQIRLSKGIVFSKSWRPIDESQNVFEFRPFAMIWFDLPNEEGEEVSPSSDKEPMTLVSDAGLVQFASKFDPINQRVGRVVGGRLEGNVIAAGPDGLTVKGRDLFFLEKSLEVYTDSPVKFTYQQHSGKAESGLKAELLASAEPPSPDQLLAVGGLRRVTLRGHVEMDFASASGPLHVTAEEAFQFDPPTRKALFRKNVVVNHSVKIGEPNLLKSDEDLLLEFEYDDPQHSRSPQQVRGDAPVVPIVRSNGPQTMSAAGPTIANNLDDSRSPEDETGPWTVRELRAGNRVELYSPSNGLSVITPSLIYDVPTRTAKLGGIRTETKPKGRELATVFVRHEPTNTELTSPYLEFTHDENGQLVAAKGHGAGRLRRRAPDSDESEFSAKWQTGFGLQQIVDSEMDLLTLFGRAVIQQPGRQAGLKADEIRLWYDRPAGASAAVGLPGIPSETKTVIDPRAATVTANTAGSRAVPESVTREFRPRQLQARDNVVVVSPQMNGETKHLIVLFDTDLPKPGGLADRSENGVRTTAGRSDDLNTNSNKSANNQSAKPPSEPLQLSADLIRANVRISSNPRDVSSGSPEAELTEVWTEGKVDIQQPREGESEPLHLTGERLHMRNANRDGEQVLHVFGQPAVIRARGFDIEGNEVFLDRPNNRTWIEGPGALRLPVKNDPFNGRTLTGSALLTVWWKEKMLFDGQTATFLDDVKAALNDSRLQCEEMEVVLKERFSFRDDGSPSPQAEVQHVLCKDGVEIDHSLYMEKELTEIRRGRFATLTLDQTTGRMEGGGPGEIALWRPGRGKRAALAPRAVAQANRPLESEISDWEFTRVTFFGKTVGNLHDRQTKFQDRVHIVYGPVARPLDTIDPDHLPKDGGDMECDSLQILQRKETATQRAFVELEAKGNAKLEGRTFNARADEITFDESKELYTLRATGNRQVTIWRQTTPNGEPSEASAKSMRFIPSQNYLRADQTTGIRGAN